MESPVLGRLFEVPATHAGGVDQRQPERVVVRLVRAELAVLQHGHAVVALAIGEVEPLAGRDLVLLGIIGSPLDGAEPHIVDHHRFSFHAGVEALRHGTHGIPEHGGELVQAQHLVVPGEVVGFRQARPRQDVVNLVREHAHPGARQLLPGIGGAAEPVGGRGGPLGRVGQELVLPVPALHVGLGGEGARGMLGEQQVPPVPWQPFALLLCDVPVELVRRGDHHPVVAVVFFLGPGVPRHIVIPGRSPHVAHAEVVVIREDAVVLPVRLDPAQPVRVAVHRAADGPRVAAGIEGRDDGVSVRSFPEADVEGDAHGRAPGELLRGEPEKPAVGPDGGHAGREAEAVREDVIPALLAELGPEVVVAVQDLADHGLGGGHVHVPLVHGRAGHAPAAVPDVSLHLLVQLGVVFLHHGVPHRTREVEHVARVLLEEPEVIHQGLLDVLLDGHRVVPPPLGIQVGIAHGVQRLALREVRLRFVVRGGQGGGEDQEEDEGRHRARGGRTAFASVAAQGVRQTHSRVSFRKSRMASGLWAFLRSCRKVSCMRDRASREKIRMWASQSSEARITRRITRSTGRSSTLPQWMGLSRVRTDSESDRR